LAERRLHRQMVGEAPAPAESATPSECAIVDEVLQQFLPFERSALLPLLQTVQRKSTTLSKGLLGYLGERVRVPFAEIYGVASFYALLNTGRPATHVRLCSGVPCILAGAEQLAQALRQNSDVAWQWFPCIGQCDRAPAALVGDEPRYRLSSADMLRFSNAEH
jgi:NADH:ubiquinone oxidoreductase subunit E